MNTLNEFKEFALKGNVVDMAVGIIIGSAFGTIVGSLVKDVIMPPIGLLLGGVDFSDIKIPLRSAGQGIRRRDHEHRHFHQQPDQLPDRGRRRIRSRQGHQRAEEAHREAGGEGARGPAADGDLPQGDPRRVGEQVADCRPLRIRPWAPGTWLNPNRSGSSCALTIYSGMFTCPPANVMRTSAGGESAIGGTFAGVIGGAPAPRGTVWTTWLGGSGRPCRRCSYIRSIA